MLCTATCDFTVIRFHFSYLFSSPPLFPLLEYKYCTVKYKGAFEHPTVEGYVHVKFLLNSETCSESERMGA